jgi:hypothetical protein
MRPLLDRKCLPGALCINKLQRRHYIKQEKQIINREKTHFFCLWKGSSVGENRQKNREQSEHHNVVYEQNAKTHFRKNRKRKGKEKVVKRSATGLKHSPVRVPNLVHFFYLSL